MPRVLVVDDESSMRFLLRVTFELEGYEVDEAPDGVAAIEEIESRRPPDLVATDFMMPLMNGGELIARIRANPDTADLPVILVSASPGSERKTSADAFFRKPFDSNELAACAAQLLERRGT
ncbi:MAG TPA: response regulator [Gaiellaceae bacterium]|nr:response regulator [Gaiellaceae bacterium]